MINVPPGSIVMTDWNILIIEYESDIIEKFLGYDINTGEFRFSSAIKEYAPHTNRGITTTGSRYCFLTPPGKLHPKAQKIYDDFCKVKEVNIKLKYEF